MGNSIRQVVASLDANLPLRELKTMEAQLDENVFAERILSRLTMQFSALATLLAAVGLYGVLSFNVTRRTREIGIRMALGSSSFGVRWLILREAAAMICGGALAGVALARASGRYIESFLYLDEAFRCLSLFRSGNCFGGCCDCRRLFTSQARYNRGPNGGA